jgi:hypothetical protein
MLQSLCVNHAPVEKTRQECDLSVIVPVASVPQHVRAVKISPLDLAFSDLLSARFQLLHKELAILVVALTLGSFPGHRLFFLLTGFLEISKLGAEHIDIVAQSQSHGSVDINKGENVHPRSFLIRRTRVTLGLSQVLVIRLLASALTRKVGSPLLLVGVKLPTPMAEARPGRRSGGRTVGSRRACERKGWFRRLWRNSPLWR